MERPWLKFYDKEVPHHIDYPYSGGTTGVAKGIMLSHFNFVANAYQVKAWGALSDEQSILAVLPLFHGFGMSVTMNAPILAGGEIILLPSFHARQVAQTIHQYKPNFFIGVPTMFVALSNLPDIGKYHLRSVKGIFVGAAPLTRAIKDDFESKTGGRMIEGYGLTEAVTAIAANPYHGLHKIGSIGIPFPDVDMKIVSLDGTRDLPPYEQGEIVLRSPTVMLGYYKMPEETAKTIVDGWLFTGDIGAYFRQNLTPYKVPSEVEFRTELPKSAIGKILRRQLREEAIRRAQSGAQDSSDAP